MFHHVVIWKDNTQPSKVVLICLCKNILVCWYIKKKKRKRAVPFYDHSSSAKCNNYLTLDISTFISTFERIASIVSGDLLQSYPNVSALSLLWALHSETYLIRKTQRYYGYYYYYYQYWERITFLSAYLLCTRHCVQWQRNWVTRRLSNLPKATQLVVWFRARELNQSNSKALCF